MKIVKILSIFFLISVFNLSNAQNCAEAFYVSKQGTKSTLESYDAKGKLQTSQTQTMKSYKGTSGGFEAVMSTTMNDKNGKTVIENRDFTVKCDNGVFKMDLSSMYLNEMKMPKDMQMELSGEGVSFPSSVSVGQELPNGESEIKMKSNGMNLMTFRFKEINRKVEKKEAITTPAGTFECFKIVSETEVKIMMKRTVKTATWIAKGVGVVRTESYSKKGEMESYMILTKLEK
jgi:hypothetical protein